MRSSFNIIQFIANCISVPCVDVLEPIELTVFQDQHDA
jgi:hypothetical protein